MSKKRRGWYCKICGEWKANEKFSGKGHASHICKSCMKLPIEKRNEMMTVNRIMGLLWHLKKEQRSWLEKMKKSENEEIRSAAEWAWAERFKTAPTMDDEEEWESDELTEEELKDLLGGEDEAEEMDIPEDFDTELPFS